MNLTGLTTGTPPGPTRSRACANPVPGLPVENSSQTVQVAPGNSWENCGSRPRAPARESIQFWHRTPQARLLRAQFRSGFEGQANPD